MNGDQIAIWDARYATWRSLNLKAYDAVIEDGSGHRAQRNVDAHRPRGAQYRITMRRRAHATLPPAAANSLPKWISVKSLI